MNEKKDFYAEIMHLMRYTYKDKWAPGNIFDGKSRLWTQAFNDLIKDGFIKKKKSYPGYEYKWLAKLPY